MNDDDDYDDECPWFTTGSGHGLDLPEVTRLRSSVSPAAHRAIQIGRVLDERGPLGFHKPVR